MCLDAVSPMSTPSPTASHKIATNVANRATRHGSRALNVALAAATPMLRRKIGAILLRAASTDEPLAQIYPKPPDKAERARLKQRNQPPPPPLYTLRVRRLTSTSTTVVRTLAIKVRRRRAVGDDGAAVGHQLPRERLASHARAARGRLAETFRQRFGRASDADAAVAAEAEGDDDDDELAAADETMPEALRDVASRVVVADVTVDLALAFGDDFEFVATPEVPWLPTAGGLVLRYLTVKARARIWWDVVGEIALLAFLHDAPPEVEWAGCAAAACPTGPRTASRPRSRRR